MVDYLTMMHSVTQFSRGSDVIKNCFHVWSHQIPRQKYKANPSSSRKSFFSLLIMVYYSIYVYSHWPVRVINVYTARRLWYFRRWNKRKLRNEIWTPFLMGVSWKSVMSYEIKKYFIHFTSNEAYSHGSWLDGMRLPTCWQGFNESSVVKMDRKMLVCEMQVYRWTS